jgi:hypothetical protein
MGRSPVRALLAEQIGGQTPPLAWNAIAALVSMKPLRTTRPAGRADQLTWAPYLTMAESLRLNLGAPRSTSRRNAGRSGQSRPAAPRSHADMSDFGSRERTEK